MPIIKWLDNETQALFDSYLARKTGKPFFDTFFASSQEDLQYVNQVLKYKNKYAKDHLMFVLQTWSISA